MVYCISLFNLTKQLLLLYWTFTLPMSRIQTKRHRFKQKEQPHFLFIIFNSKQESQAQPNESIAAQKTTKNAAATNRRNKKKSQEQRTTGVSIRFRFSECYLHIRTCATRRS